MSQANSEIGNFANESVLIKEIDYYFTNSIARSSKTMSDCKKIDFKSIKEKDYN